MAVSNDDLAVIDAVLSGDKALSGAWLELRERLPHLSWSRCDAADVLEDPFRRYPGADLHLMDRSAHCIRLTMDLGAATGVVLAQRSERP